MDLEQIKELMNHLEKSKLTKLEIKKGDFELRLEKEIVQSVVSRPSKIQVEHFAESPSENSLKVERGGPARVDLPGAYVTSPMVGTYYSTPSPDNPPFVKVGDRVNENTVVCIIEAMKVMNEVKAGISGVVAEILAENSQPVEFGTRLLRIV